MSDSAGAGLPRLPEGDALYGSPTAAELVASVRHFVEEEASPLLEGVARFHARVAANALAIVERELTQGEEARAEHGALLAGEGYASERQLADAVRAGAFDGREGELAALLRATVALRLAVANPAYAGGGARARRSGSG
jgi:hypothetical protein